MNLCYEFKIDGNPVVTPDCDVSFEQKDVESTDSGKDESGVVHRFLLRSGVKSWSFNYTHLSVEEYGYMANLMRGKTAFQFSYPDGNGVTKTCTAYCPGGAVAIRNLRTGIYSSYSFKIVEC